MGIIDPKYRENQSGWWIVVLLALPLIYILFVKVTKGEYSGLSTVFVIVSLSLVIPMLLFYRLKTEIFGHHIKLNFGIGIVSKKIDLNKVAQVIVVRNKWYYGWGIRYVWNGWMWNIWGLSAVELKFKDKKNIFRIGSQDPKKLKEKIDEQLKHNS